MVALFSVFMVLLFLRLFVWRRGALVAIDQYFWTLYRDVRKRTRGEMEMPQYLSVAKLWTVPLFGRCLALLPDSFFANSNLLMLMLSFVRCGLILLWGSLFVGDISFGLTLCCFIIYLSSPILVIHDNQLNARIGGAFLFDFLLAAGFSYSVSGSVSLLIVMVGCVCVLCFLHKLTLQLALVGSLLFACCGSFSWLATILLGGAFAFLLGYRKYAFTHYDISAYWFRNRAFLSTHQIKDSPIYGQNLSMREGHKHRVFQLATLLGMCPWAVALVILQIPYWSVVCAGILFVALLITFVPMFKCWGHGRNYTYFLIAPVIYGIISTDTIFDVPFLFPLCFGALLVFLLSIHKYIKWSTDEVVSEVAGCDSVWNVLAESPLDRVCCIPFSLTDQAVFRTGKSCFGMTHGCGVRWMEPYFPVFRQPLERAIHEWNLGGVLVQKSYWPDFRKQVDQSLFEAVLENDDYLLLKVSGWLPGTRIPIWARSAYPALKDQLPEDEV